MAKSAGFPHDSYRFLISGIRDADETGVLERYMGAAQQEFERTYRKIESLKDLAEPSDIRGDLVEFLCAIVGWDQTEGQSFVTGLSEAQFRKLARLSAAIWKTKGQGQNLKDLLRIFTGKSAFLGDYFFNRLLLGNGYIQLTGYTGDPWLTGGRYSTLDEYLFILTINRVGLDEDDERLIYDLLNYMKPALEHIVVSYVAFFDDFVTGELGRWTQSGTGTAEVIGTRNALRATPTTTLTMAVEDDELATWEGWFHVRAQLQWGSTSTTGFAWRLMRQDGGDYYQASISYDGTIGLRNAAGTVATTTVSMVTTGIGPAFGVSVEPLDQARSRVQVFYAGAVVITHTFEADEALATNDLPPQLRVDGGTGSIDIDIVMAQAAPWHAQLIGQRPITSTGMSVQDPGLEPFEPSKAPPEVQPHLFDESSTGWTGWSTSGGWAIDNFASFQSPRRAMWFSDHGGSGPYPAHGTDPNYETVASGFLRSAIYDLSSYPSSTFSMKARIYFHAPLVAETGGTGALEVLLQYNIGAGWVDIGEVGSGAVTATSVGNIYPADSGDPRIGSGTGWWKEELWDIPSSVMGESTVRFRLQANTGQPYTTTDFGFAVSRFSLFVHRT